MVVNIVDLDDNPPYFELAEYQTELILETVQIGTVVLEGMLTQIFLIHCIQKH